MSCNEEKFDMDRVEVVRKEILRRVNEALNEGDSSKKITDELKRMIREETPCCLNQSK